MWAGLEARQHFNPCHDHRSGIDHAAERQSWALPSDLCASGEAVLLGALSLLAFAPTLVSLLWCIIRARCDVVIASIYVNPTQFAANEDFGVYPRRRQDDLDKLAAAGCDAAFTPSSLYHTASSSATASDGSMVVGVNDDASQSRMAHSTWVQVDGVSTGLCAQSRPHFFRGVCTVSGWPVATSALVSCRRQVCSAVHMLCSRAWTQSFTCGKQNGLRDGLNHDESHTVLPKSGMARMASSAATDDVSMRLQTDSGLVPYLLAHDNNANRRL